MTQLDAILDIAIRNGRAPGLAAAVLTPEGDTIVASAGVRGPGDPTLVTAETMFHIASCTKPVTSIAALQLVERGLVGLDDPVGPHLPALAQPMVLDGFDERGEPVTRPAKTAITLRHLLTHMSGLAYDFTSKELLRYLRAMDMDIRQIGAPDLPLMFDPGEAWQYGVGVDWAGILVTEVTGQSLEDYCRENIFRPLGMTDTTFFMDAGQQSRRAPMHAHGPDGSYVPVPFEMPPEPHFWMGGGGLHSTPNDFILFLATLARGGSPLVNPTTFAEMLRNQTGDLDAGTIETSDPMMSNDFQPLKGLRRRHGLAGLLNLDPVSGGRSVGSMGWAGITNCYYWVDPNKRAAGVLMSQMMPFADSGVLEVFEAVERSVYASSVSHEA